MNTIVGLHTKHSPLGTTPSLESQYVDSIAETENHMKSEAARCKISVAVRGMVFVRATKYEVRTSKDPTRER
jgi:hypothetical protein